jgi:hypothetical protein
MNSVEFLPSERFALNEGWDEFAAPQGELRAARDVVRGPDVLVDPEAVIEEAIASVYRAQALATQVEFGAYGVPEWRRLVRDAAAVAKECEQKRADRYVDVTALLAALLSRVTSALTGSDDVDRLSGA